MKKTLVLLISIVLLVVAGKSEGNLLVNGSFEYGMKWQDNVPVGSTGITGWTVTRGNIDLVDWYWQASDGNRSLDLNGSPGVGGIAQAFVTVPGQLYQVQFDQAANPYYSHISIMGVQAAGQSAHFMFDCTGYTNDNMGWTTRIWEFTAAGTITTLEFYSLYTADPRVGPALDNVVVTLIPEPTTISLLSLGAILVWRKRRTGEQINEINLRLYRSVQEDR